MKFKIPMTLILVIVSAAFPGRYTYANQQAELGFLINKQRVIHGQQKIVESKELDIAAQNHAEDMVKKKYFSHTNKDGISHQERIKKQGYEACYTAENIAEGQNNAAQVITDWMGSQGHRLNVLSPKPKEFGAGIAGKVWVIVFARKC